ncbi:zinc-dependent metalloprotease [Neptunitalea lumnitzerae]|uniref:Glutaminyl-tRNA synthetase n=1 Tax=Neptunitalea lumnitzerae TaxID=2965509 RepID=A0ABQ5MN33_9FLAO|nr:zinc-dependent metalloprotease [Neptunitalea sp. Y10]GLB50804.1 glutaminyl-tRNA synthetase [Neptunitalea sp. Y10]
MKNHISLTFLLLCVGLCNIQYAEAQFWKKKDKKKQTEQPKPTPKGSIQPYSKVITKDAITDDGLFKVHKIEEKEYYEIPDSLFGREMLMVSRIAKTASGLGFGGGKANTQVLRWEKKDKKVLLRIVSYNIYAADSLPIHEAVVNSNFEPILETFDIKAEKKDSVGNSTVIQINNLFEKDVKALGLPEWYRKKYKVSRIDGDKSFIDHIKSYPLNIEARHVKTYAAGDPPSNSSLGTISVEMNASMILLPKEPMKRRYFDQRVGWFTTRQTDYGLDVQQSKTIQYLDRWRLEVKDEDLEKFKRGELVEPKKPIVYYIDRATPKKWVPFIKQGIEDWQVAFEKAGFKNAIIAKDAPTVEEDPEWSPEDIRYSVVRYLASPIPNANGPHVSDPRSGEILESDINWYHNVMSLLRGWFFVQTAAINPDAQSPEFKDEVMGRLIRFVSSHEVGHTLGLPHNMGSSVAYPVDSLRSASFTQKYGTAPSIMDYARFNYVAQPEDKGVALMPNIGIYDKYAIEWGYKPLLDKTATEEKETLDSWILAHENDPMYRFGSQQWTVIDPSSQTEDLGDDAIKASLYGIENLKRIVPNLITWTYEKGEDFEELEYMYGQVLSQYNRYMGHVISNIGGVYEFYKTYDQEGAVYVPVAKEHQENCMAFIQEQLFTTPEWMLDETIFNKIESAGAIERIRKLQVNGINKILDFGRMQRLIENETFQADKAYSLLEMMTDLRDGIFSELSKGKTIDTYRRNLQRAYIDRMEYLMTEDQGQTYGDTSVNVSQSDIRAIVRGELDTLQKKLKSATYRTSDTTTKYHLQDLIKRIDLILNPTK